MKHEEIIKKIELADECHMEIGGNFGRTMTITMEEAWLFKQLLEQQANGFSTDSGQSNISGVVKSLPNKYCPQCGEPIAKPHKFWCEIKP